VRQYIGFEDEDPKEIERIKETLAAQSEREHMISKSYYFHCISLPFTMINKLCNRSVPKYLIGLQLLEHL
jgi:hypothetical protein